jgi:hypothetical protein
MVVVAQLVRALDCGSKGRGFESHLPPKQRSSYLIKIVGSFIFITLATYPQNKKRDQLNFRVERKNIIAFTFGNKSPSIKAFFSERTC